MKEFVFSAPRRRESYKRGEQHTFRESPREDVHGVHVKSDEVRVKQAEASRQRKRRSEQKIQPFDYQFPEAQGNFCSKDFQFTWPKIRVA